MGLTPSKTSVMVLHVSEEETGLVLLELKVTRSPPHALYMWMTEDCGGHVCEIQSCIVTPGSHSRAIKKRISPSCAVFGPAVL